MTLTMSDRAVATASGALGRHTSRRGFLTQAALVGSALVAAPTAYLLRPNTAYAAICSCAGTSCSCGDLCCDGYTELCCTLYGANSCPPGSIAAGWWKADGSGFCDVNGSPQPRYYIDCNSECNGCDCGASGHCSRSCADCSCGCASGDCHNRKACCTQFRYGQCNQEVPCVGPIVCRVITCAPPWEFEPSCTTATATDNFTRSHDAPCLHPSPLVALPAYFRAGSWHLSSSLAGGTPDQVFAFGEDGDWPVFGDWNGDGVRTPGVVRVLRFGRFGDGQVQWVLRNGNETGGPDLAFTFGRPGGVPVVGDWDGSGVETPGMVYGNQWELKMANSGGDADAVFTFGPPDGSPVAGDWNGNGVDTIGMVSAGGWTLRNSLGSGSADLEFTYGSGGDIPVTGDWNGDGLDTCGVVRDGTWFLRNANSAGQADVTFDFGGAGDLPVPWGSSLS